jgi:hypothetical protein
MYYRYPDSYFSNYVPGTTAGPSSPGAIAYPIGLPATPGYAGTELPPAVAAQTAQATQSLTLDQLLQEVQLEQGAIALQSSAYTQGYLRKLIGKTVRVEFLIGESNFQDRIGILLEVGIDYIILREVETDDNLLCDAFSIKFVNEYR